MNRHQLLIRARRCHRSASAIRVHATSAPFASRKAALHEWEIAEKLEALADKLEREALAHLPLPEGEGRPGTFH
jgi:hypothetical protein